MEVGHACGVQASCGRGLEDVGVPRGVGLGRKIEEKLVGWCYRYMYIAKLEHAHTCTYT